MSETDKQKLLRYRERFPSMDVFAVNLLDLDTLKDDCLIVLDTNVMLELYENTDVTFKSAAKIYRQLAASSRLCLLGHVAREFAQHRPEKIIAIREHIRSSFLRFNLPDPKGPAPLFDTATEYKELRELEKQTLEAIKEKTDHYRGEAYKLRQKLLKQVDSWGWNDPITKLYREVFPAESQHDISVDQEELRVQLNERRELMLPPGLTDDENAQNPAGDLLVWNTLLDLAKTRKQNVLFVCNERKPDWWFTDKARELYQPAFELVEEFWRETEGKTLAMVDFPAFLAMFGADDEAVSDAERQLENADTFSPFSGEDTSPTFIASEYSRALTQVRLVTYNRLDEFTSQIIQSEFYQRFHFYVGTVRLPSKYTFSVAYHRLGPIDELLKVAVQVYDVRPSENFSDPVRFDYMLATIRSLLKVQAREAELEGYTAYYLVVLVPSASHAVHLAGTPSLRPLLMEVPKLETYPFRANLEIGFLQHDDTQSVPIYVHIPK